MPAQSAEPADAALARQLPPEAEVVRVRALCPRGFQAVQQPEGEAVLTGEVRAHAELPELCARDDAVLVLTESLLNACDLRGQLGRALAENRSRGLGGIAHLLRGLAHVVQPLVAALRCRRLLSVLRGGIEPSPHPSKEPPQLALRGASGHLGPG